MARITVEDCLTRIGDENRFSLIHLAVTRVKQQRNGQPVLTKGKNKEIVMSLREIAAGEVSFDNIKELQAPKPEANPENESAAEETTATEA
ncbi:MAG: DNA-directed RNA polymerase subunit omega [Desulfobulbaceae bacterium]|nr:DNA-directed RNA polymerase subunit omega [Desulfobulbaceae bacterium]